MGVKIDKDLIQRLAATNKRIRDRYDLTQRDFAARIGYTASTVSNLESGKCMMQVKYMRAVAGSFNLLPSEAKIIDDAIYFMENPKAKIVIKDDNADELKKEIAELQKVNAKLGKENAIYKRRLRDLKHLLRQKLV